MSPWRANTINTIAVHIIIKKHSKTYTYTVTVLLQFKENAKWTKNVKISDESMIKLLDKAR